MYKVIFIIVPSYSKSEWLNKKMMQITKSSVSFLNLDNYPVKIVQNYNDINQFLNQAEFLIVSTAGDIVIDRDHLLDKINSIPNNIGLHAHILQYENDNTPYIHEQFFIINTNAVKKINLSFKEEYDDGIELLRSDEDMHNGHAPLYVTLGKNNIKRKMQFGSNLIEECLCNNFQVRNFDLDWRTARNFSGYLKKNTKVQSRGYCHPKKSTKIFENSLRTLTIRPELDEAQEIFINLINEMLEYNVLNVWHNHAIPKFSKKINHILCPASGFVGEMLAIKHDAKKITFFDINKNNLNFKKQLYLTWDGMDYDLFATTWARTNDLLTEPSFEIDKNYANIYSQETKNDFFSNWCSKSKEFKIDYIYEDLVGSEKIINSITENSLIFTSTILGMFLPTAIMHDEHKIKNTIEKIQKKIKETNSIWVKD